MVKSPYLSLQNISIFSPVLSILVFLLFPFNWKQKLKWTIFILAISSIGVDVICKYFAVKSIPTIWFINIFTFIEAQILFLFFYLLFFENKKIRKLLIYFASAFLVVWVSRNLVFKNINNYDYLSQALEFIFLLFLCLLYFFQKTKVTDTIFIYNYYEFWIVSALLMYCAGTLFSFFTPMNPNENNLDTQLFEKITRYSSILKNLLMSIAFCVNNKTSSNNLINPNSIYYMNDLKD